MLTVDGVGERSTTTYGTGRAKRIQLTYHLQFPHSLELLYAAVTNNCSFKVNSGEYKLMGLAPYASRGTTICSVPVGGRDCGEWPGPLIGPLSCLRSRPAQVVESPAAQRLRCDLRAVQRRQAGGRPA
jgi:hypothetical protein